MTKRSLQELKLAVDARLREMLREQAPGHLGALHAAEFHHELAAFVLRPGKRVRPLLFLLSLRVFRGEAEAGRPEYLEIAAALELLHAFVLVHDDVIDNSDYRRGLPTLHRSLDCGDGAGTGRDLAIVAGDLLFARAQQAILRSGLPPEVCLRVLDHLMGTILDTGMGEAGDILFSRESIEAVPEEDIHTMYFLKTTRYTIETPMSLAAICAGMGGEVIEALTRAAAPVGLAFQIENDLAKFREWQAPGATPLPDDLAGHRKTVVLRSAWQRLDPRGRTRLDEAFHSCPMGAEEARVIARLVDQSGAIPHLEKQVDRLFLRGEGQLQQSGLRAAHKSGIAQLFRLLRGLTQGAAPKAAAAPETAAGQPRRAIHPLPLPLTTHA